MDALVMTGWIMAAVAVVGIAASIVSLVVVLAHRARRRA